MRDPKEKKFAGLTFSIGCVSQSSVEVADDQQHGKAQQEPNPSPPGGGPDETGNGGSKSTAKNPLGFGFGFVPLQRMIKSFKDLSQRFSFREEDEDDEEEEVVEMEIGFPTDVQHVGHIGWDGTTSSLTKIKACDGSSSSSSSSPSSSSSSSQPYSFPSVYLRQFELAMAAHADGSHRFGLP